ncbi:TcpQ domain-containing protein [Thiolapillus sp.]|uniref:TcpQ domain-containing protein n=6 Tax=Thiolapillus sp. TaxID=2017437 RepID=UPI0025EDA8D4|nr:TcpQ domain-containing protein [Thiolapillus sp.]
MKKQSGKKLKLAVVLVGLVAAQGSQAYFSVEEMPKPKPVPVSAGGFMDYGYPLQQIGTGYPGKPVEGYGNQNELRDAFALIAPEGWRLITPDRTVRKDKVDWKGGKTWLSILEDLGARNRLYFVVDWSGKQVMATRKKPNRELIESNLKQTKKAKAAQEKVSPKNKKSTARVVNGVPVPKMASAMATGSHSVKASKSGYHAYRLEKGKTIRENLQRWCDAEGWTLVWSASVDYPVIASATYTAKRVDVAASQLAQTLKHAKAPLSFRASTNKVLRVMGGQEWSQR